MASPANQLAADINNEAAAAAYQPSRGGMARR
jgi:hypothetical protein